MLLTEKQQNMASQKGTNIQCSNYSVLLQNQNRNIKQELIWYHKTLQLFNVAAVVSKQIKIPIKDKTQLIQRNFRKVADTRGI